MRLFVGIPLAAEVITELSAVTMRLQSNNDGLRWSPPDLWHITLQFLGNTGAEQFKCVVEQLRKLHLPPVPIKLELLDLFDRAGIFFVGVRLTPGLLSLQEHVCTATSLCAFVPETRPYRPHVTLARSRGKGPGQAFHALKSRIHHQPTFTRFTADAFLLYESLPAPTGSQYEIRERFLLDGGSRAGS
ncbi:MAG TPA: RNA 2',3'-cyclic phosphodiesterase [Acidisarcina sp.]|nr:RNA 2',3'-cyclic phosphodiesterase [Acidisarcina sp.]